MKGTIHWVSAEHSVPAEVRLYDRLFTEPNPDAGKDADYIQYLNPHSLDVVKARVEPSLAGSQPGDRFQFERTGYFIADEKALLYGTSLLASTAIDFLANGTK